MAAPAPAGEDLAERYLWYLDVGRQSLVDALALVSRAGQPAAGLPLRGRQGPDRGAGRPGARHPGRGRRGHRGRLRDHRRPDGADPRSLPFRPRPRRADGRGAGLAVRRRGGDHGPVPRPSSRSGSAGPGPGPSTPGWTRRRSTGWRSCCSSRPGRSGRGRRAGPRRRPLAGAAAAYTGAVLAALWEPILAGALLVRRRSSWPGSCWRRFLLWRYGRRKWRAFHSHGAVVGAVALWEATAAARFETAGAVDARGRVPGGTPTGAQGALAVGRPGRAPPCGRPPRPVRRPPRSRALCRLHEVAVGLDQVLRVESVGTVPGRGGGAGHRGHAGGRRRPAAAVASASDANGQRVRDLVRDADHEIQCLDAGLASARAALPPRHR